MQYIKDFSPHKNQADQTGFTLIEIVMVIVILGVLGIAGADFIGQMFLGFRDANTRLEMYEEGKAALARMERELHGMLPNAVCVTNDQGVSCEAGGAPANEIRFGLVAEDVMRLNTLSGGYRETAFDFPRTVPATLTEMGASGSPAGQIVSIYNTSWATFVGGERLFAVTGVSGSEMTFGGQTITDPSPRSRYYLVDRAISYRFDLTDRTLYRSNVNVTAGGAVNFSGATEYPLARDIDDFKFYYATPSLARNGIVSILFTMSKNGQNIVMHKEIHVKNVP